MWKVPEFKEESENKGDTPPSPETKECPQSLTISHNPFQRRAGLANFNLDLASEARFGLLHISVSYGIELARWLESRN